MGGIVFTAEQIQSLNELELEVYNYIMKNNNRILEMKHTCRQPLFCDFVKRWAVMDTQSLKSYIRCI